MTGLIESAIASKQPYRAEYRVLRPDGKTIEVEALGKVHYSAQGQPLRFVGTSVDVTERNVLNRERATALHDLRLAHEKLKLSETALREEKELRERYVLTLSHDLTTPLTASKLSIQLALKCLQSEVPEGQSGKNWA